MRVHASSRYCLPLKGSCFPGYHSNVFSYRISRSIALVSKILTIVSSLYSYFPYLALLRLMSTLQELMSETSIQLRTQIPSASGNVSVDSNGNSIMALGNTQAQKYAKQKPRFVEFACSHQEVSAISILPQVMDLIMSGLSICRFSHQCCHSKILLGLESQPEARLSL